MYIKIKKNGCEFLLFTLYEYMAMKDNMYSHMSDNITENRLGMILIETMCFLRRCLVYNYCPIFFSKLQHFPEVSFFICTISCTDVFEFFKNYMSFESNIRNGNLSLLQFFKRRIYSTTLVLFKHAHVLSFIVCIKVMKE